MERLFQILAVILAGVAAYFFWQGNTEISFISGVFAAVSFFLSVRFQVRERMRQRVAEEEAEIEEENSETSQLNEIPANEQINNEQRMTDKEPKI
jgi:hypothetical protein